MHDVLPSIRSRPAKNRLRVRPPLLAVLVLFALFPFNAWAETPRLSMDDSGVAALLIEGERQAWLNLSVFGAEKGYYQQLAATHQPHTGFGSSRRYSGVFPIPGTKGDEIAYQQEVTIRDTTAADFSYQLRVQSKKQYSQVTSLQLSVFLAPSAFAGRKLHFQGRSAAFVLPERAKDGYLMRVNARGVSIDLPIFVVIFIVIG